MLTRKRRAPVFNLAGLDHYFLVIWILVVLTSATEVGAQSQYKWTYFGPAYGMGMSFNKMLQDQKGFLWLGSTNGLYRYDGYDFTFFKKYTARPTGLSSDWIWDLAEDEKGNIWIATYSGGLNRWNREKDRITHYRHEPGNPETLSGDMVLKLLFAPDGDLWMIVQQPDGEFALNKLDPGSGKINRYSAADALAGGMPALIAQPAANLHPMAFDSGGRLWVGTTRGLHYYDPEQDTFIRCPLQAPALTTYTQLQIINIYASPVQKDILWIAAATEDLRQGAIYRLHVPTLRSDRLFSTSGSGDAAPLSLWQPAGNSKELWFSSTRLHRLQLDTEDHQSYELKISSSVPVQTSLRSRMQTINAGQKGNLWITPLGMSPTIQIRGSDNYFSISGIEHFNTASNTSRYFSEHPLRPGQPFPSIRSVLEDRSGLLWLGAYLGFFKLDPDAHANRPRLMNFELPRTYADPNLPTNLRAVWQAAPGVFWLGTYNGGLHRLNLPDDSWTSYGPAPGGLRHQNIYTLYFDESRNQLWIGHEAGIDLLAVAPNSESPPPPTAFRPLQTANGLLDTRVNTIVDAAEGKVWIGTATKGLLLFDLRSGKVLRQYTTGELPSSFVQAVFTDARGDVWVSPNMGGCCRLPGGDSDASFECFLEGLYIVDFEEIDDTIWMAAMNYGIVRFDNRRDTFDLLTMDNRLLRNTATGIEQDSLGRIWFTSLGLSRYDPDTETYQFYDREDGIRDLDPERCFFKTREGLLIYAGVNGSLQFFDPEAVKDNAVLPKVVLTGFELFNAPLQPADQGPLRKNIEVAEEVRLSHRQHSFSVQYAGLEFTEPLKNKYRYQLLGIDSGWVYTGRRREARYNTVPPGRYTFLLDAANADGIWSERPAKLPIIIRPPWWQRTWAFLLFLALTIGAGAVTYNVIRRRLELTAQLRTEHQEAERLKKLDRVKNQFLSNLSHEFRTPMTLIQGLIQQLPDFHRQGESERIIEAVNIIRRNSEQLLNLVNQLLDLSRIQTSTLPPNREQGDLIPFLRYLVQAFQPQAGQQGIDLWFESPKEKLIMDFDQDKMQKIVRNLLSNALKFTPAGGKVIVSADEIDRNGPHLKLEVQDTGIGIAAEEQESIFQSFYQIEDSITRRRNGTGIGLTLTRAFVHLLGGEIWVRSRDGAGSTFMVLLPITRQAPPMKSFNYAPVEAPEAPAAVKTEKSGFKEGQPLLLIVEDSKDLIRFLSYCLKDQYRLEFAHNGREGIEKATALTPDLIISDVMMPEADGLELCKVLKARHSTSHIPIILLTARAGEEDLLAGLRQGADAYLTKPFLREELMVRIDRLLELRRRLRERYSQLSPPADMTSTPEDSFIIKARYTVEKHIADSAFGVGNFAEAMNLSRAQLNRKLTYLTEKSPVQFIRQIRMEKALKLLRNTDMNVSEVAFATGFQDPSYFSRIFTQTYGKPPSAMR